MKTFKEACRTISHSVSKSNKSEIIRTNDSHLRILSKDYLSKLNHPRTNLSSMDGVVIHKNDINRKTFKISGESTASDEFAEDFKSGECNLVFTGAPIFGKDKLVIPKEDFISKKNSITVKSYSKVNFIREKATDLKKSKKYLNKNSIITIRSLVLAKLMRIEKLKVLKKLRVCVISTGNEIINIKNKKCLVQPTNHLFIEYLVKKFGGEVIRTSFSNDDQGELIKTYKSLKEFDLLITSGGISRGKYDIVKTSLKLMGLKILFDRVAIKPGKPTTFGKFSKEKFFLGLPGNPVSCFMCMINFFPVFVNAFYGTKLTKFRSKKLISKYNIEKNNNLTSFCRVMITKRSFTVFKNQDSSLLNILKKADGILIRKPFDKKIIAGEEVEIYLFDNIIQSEI
jgi:molybdopterin molybdotransferase